MGRGPAPVFTTQSNTSIALRNANTTATPASDAVRYGFEARYISLDLSCVDLRSSGSSVGAKVSRQRRGGWLAAARLALVLFAL